MMADGGQTDGRIHLGLEEMGSENNMYFMEHHRTS